MESNWQASDIDHIVVGPGGVYCISTKNLRGLFELQSDGRVFYNNGPTRLIGNTMSQAMQVRERMAALVGADVPFVTPILAVQQAFVAFGVPQKGVWLLTQEDLTKVIEGGGKRLTKQMISRCVNAWKMLLNTRPELYRRATSSTTSTIDRAEAT